MLLHVIGSLVSVRVCQRISSWWKEGVIDLPLWVCVIFYLPFPRWDHIHLGAPKIRRWGANYCVKMMIVAPPPLSTPDERAFCASDSVLARLPTPPNLCHLIGQLLMGSR